MHSFIKVHKSDDNKASVVIDPVCGMTVNPDFAAGSYEYKGKTYYFCSPHCLSSFRKDAERFLKEPMIVARQNQLHKRVDAAADHPPGPSDPVATASGSDRTTYTCPMHPEIVRNAPGSCPICGMALELKTITVDEEENPELNDMTRRFKVSTVLTIPLVYVAMGGYIPAISPEKFIPM